MTSSTQSTAIENQSTFCLWFHYCYVGCTSPWHGQSDPQTTYLLSNFETDLNADTSKINDKDVKVWRLDLLNNSDGDATKRSPRAEDVVAEEDRMEGYLNSIEECEKVFGELCLFVFLFLDPAIHPLIVLSRLYTGIDQSCQKTQFHQSPSPNSQKPRLNPYRCRPHNNPHSLLPYLSKSLRHAHLLPSHRHHVKPSSRLRLNAQEPQQHKQQNWRFTPLGPSFRIGLQLCC